MPADWRVDTDGSPWSARAVAPTGESRCIIEWWPAGFIPDDRHREAPADDHPGQLWHGTRGTIVRAYQHRAAVLACAWSSRDVGTAELVARIFDSLRVVEAPARPPASPGTYRQLCTFEVHARGRPPDRRVLALARDGSAWIGDVAGAELRRLAGADHRAIACDSERGLLHRHDRSVEVIDVGAPAGTVTPAPSEFAVDGQALALAARFVVRGDGRLTWWNDWSPPRTSPSHLPQPRVAPHSVLAAWGTYAGGCVLTTTGTLWCWRSDEEPLESPPLRFSGPGRLVNTHTGEHAYDPEPFELPLILSGALPEPPVVARLGAAMCVRLADEWTCIDRVARTRRIPACSAQPCRCAVDRSGALACSDEPLAEVAAAPPRRWIDDVLLAAPNFCVERRDGAIACHADDRETVLRPAPDREPTPPTGAP